MLLYIRRLFYFLLLILLASLLFYITYRRSPESALFVISDNQIKSISTSGNIIFVPEVLIPNKARVVSIHQNRWLSIEYTYDLSSGFLYDLDSSLKLLRVRYSVLYKVNESQLESLFKKYNLMPDTLDEFVQKQIFFSIDEFYNHNFTSIELPNLKEKWTSFHPELTSTITKDLKILGIELLEINLQNIKTPPLEFFTKAMSSKDEIIKKLTEKKNAEHKGELLAIEQKKKDEAILERLEKLTLFLQKHPEMNTQAIWGFGNTTNTIIVPLDYDLPKTIKNKTKIQPKVIE